jgi:hypothetical protein
MYQSLHDKGRFYPYGTVPNADDPHTLAVDDNKLARRYLPLMQDVSDVPLLFFLCTLALKERACYHSRFLQSYPLPKTFAFRYYEVDSIQHERVGAADRRAVIIDRARTLNNKTTIALMAAQASPEGKA